MRKTIMAFIVFLFSLGLGGCVSMPLKQYSEVLPKENTVFLGEVSVFKGMNVTMSGIKDIGKPTDDPYYQEVAKEYTTALEKDLIKNGFVVVKEVTSQSLVIKTKIGDRPPLLGGWLGAVGTGVVGTQVEVYQNGKLLLYFEEAVAAGNPEFCGVQAKGQIKRHIVPRIAEKLKEKFL